MSTKTAPTPQARVIGLLDMVRCSSSSFALQLDDGTEIIGTASTDSASELPRLLGKRVLVRGRITRDQSGRPPKIIAESLELAMEDGSIWSAAPSPAELDVSELRQPQTPETGIGAIIGKWPGDETDEEVAAALEQLS